VLREGATMNASDTDVVIVGYGPVGALTALLLAEEGLCVRIVERSLDPVELPRAVGLDAESVRSFQRIGQGEAVAAILQPPREGERISFADSQRRILFGIEMPEEGMMGWRDLSYFDQPELEALLRELVSKQPGIEVTLGASVTDVASTPDHAEVSGTLASGEAFALRAPFVIGCDGASSSVRESVGIEWRSLGYDQDWLVIDIVIGPEAELPVVMMQICDPARLVTYVPVKDPNRRWEFQLLPGETREEMLRPERIEDLLRDWLPPEHYTLRRAAVYQFHAATANAWRAGRVLLAGDAAHQTPPFLGQGLNSGFRDAVNLGWKIPLVARGVCDARLLDTYAEERDAHAFDLVGRAIAIGKLMETLAAREAGLPDPHADGPGDGSPNIPPLRDGVLIAEQTHPGCAGRMFVQPTVRAKGTTCRLDELLGRGFAVVARTEADARLGPEAETILGRLDSRVVVLDELEVVRGEMDLLLASHPAAVVRPDRYLFGVVDDAWSLDRLIGELGRKLALV
jgi:3-(3-hydroxy-phenyl)propionate hydroxylase